VSGLEVDELQLYYGRSHIVQGVSLTVDAGEIVALLGRNGVGKTTLARGIVELLPPASGTVRFAGADLTKLPAHRVAGHGVRIIADNHVIPAGRGRIFGAGSVRKPIRIGSDVWIGANCVVLAGTTIGEGAVVGAGSVVTRDVEPYSVVAGSPARVLRVRD